MQKSQVYKILLREYDQRQTKNALEAEHRREEVYKRLPRIREIDQAIAAGGIRLAMASAEDPQSVNAQISKYKAESRALMKEKEFLLKENNLPKRYMEPHYQCRICKDSGFVGSEECACFRQRRIDMAYDTYTHRDRLKDENFDNFDRTLYSTKVPEGRLLSPRKNAEKIVQYSMRYIKDFEKHKSNILFFGAPGLGKTFLCNCIAKELMDSGYIVMYLTAFQLFNLIDDFQFNRIEPEEKENLMNDLLNSDLLIVDDIGTEFSTSLTSSSFFNIINSRTNAKKPMIISTNLTLPQLKEMYSERISSRFIGDFTYFEFYGDDIRELKKFGVQP